MPKVALITGGASGMGFAVAESLANKGWHTILLDFNEKAGKAAATSIPNATFRKVDVTSWASLSSAFDEAFTQYGTLNFVFANAGIVEKDSFYQKHDTTKSRIPPEPNQMVSDVNYKSVVNTSYLAQHYFRLSPHRGKDGVLIMTASCGALYPSEYCPMYSGSKAGVLHFMRALASAFYNVDGIRTYAICPGTVRTNLLDHAGWSQFPDEYFTPVEAVSKTVVMLVEGGEMTDAAGRKIKKGEDWGLGVEIIGDRIYFRDHVDYCDEPMKEMMLATKFDAGSQILEGSRV